MKEELIKKDVKQNLVERVKAIKEVGNVYENAMDNNAKNTKELYELLKKVLETNEQLSEHFRKIIEKEIEAYERAIDKSTSEEERKRIYDKLEKLIEEAKENYNDCMVDSKELRESAVKVDEDSKRFNWEIVLKFGIGVLAVIEVVNLGTKGFDVAKKYIAKK